MPVFTPAHARALAYAKNCACSLANQGFIPRGTAVYIAAGHVHGAPYHFSKRYRRGSAAAAPPTKASVMMTPHPSATPFRVCAISRLWRTR